jgi:hypothetical protein
MSIYCHFSEAFIENYIPTNVNGNFMNVNCVPTDVNCVPANVN